MSRYIDADALREKMFHKAFEEDSPDQKWDSGCWIRYHMFEDTIESMPTADVVERKKGKWKPFDRTWGRSIYHCTACGEAEDCPTEMGKVIWRFCPNCGAEMKGEKDE